MLPLLANKDEYYSPYGVKKAVKAMQRKTDGSNATLYTVTENGHNNNVL